MSSRVIEAALRSVERGAFPRFRKWFWKRLYNQMSRLWADDDWRFMNYGYVAGPDVAPFELQGADEHERAFIGLYHQAVDSLDIAGKNVLEVGSGRGGGSAYITRYHKPGSMVGIDFSSETVKRAQQLNADIPGLAFRHGDAEAIPFGDASFDVVVNVESSHCYSNVAAFVGEAARVLKPGGIFTWADMRAPSMLPGLNENFNHPDLALIAETDLSHGVIRALDMANDRKVARISRFPVLNRFLKEFAGTQGSVLYGGLHSGDVVYLARRYRKAG